ncbi:MAG: cupin domain-containing protein [Holophaga sp.]|jgi:mannose-6-phosphate isomerase-like protein (cupin superfamily)
MPTISHIRSKDIPMTDLGGGLRRGLMLPDQMDGVETFKCLQAAGSQVTPRVYPDRIQIFFFTKGTGYIGTRDRAHNITEVAVFVPMLDQESFFIQAGADLEYLHFIVKMNDFDRTEFRKCRMYLPHFALLSQCPRYHEDFKGPSVKSYTIVEHDNLARISMGLIVSDGGAPDNVGEHVHANLQQWYVGLPGCRFAFTAEGETIPVEEGDCTCIPKGARHSVRAEAGGRIHYVWFELKC